MPRTTSAVATHAACGLRSLAITALVAGAGAASAASSFVQTNLVSNIPGLAAVTIRRSHHIACLATFLPTAIEAGMMAIIACSDPSEAVVAPAGGRTGVFTPDARMVRRIARPSTSGSMRSSTMTS